MEGERELGPLFQHHRPNAYMDGFKSSFISRTTATWSGLTTEAVSSETVDGFKSKTKHPRIAGSEGLGVGGGGGGG